MNEIEFASIVTSYNERIDKNLEALLSLSSDQFPSLHKFLADYGGVAHRRITACLASLRHDRYTQPHKSGIISFISMRALAGMNEGTVEAWTRYIALFSAWRLIEKVQSTDAHSTPAQRASIQLAIKNHQGNPVMWYHVPEYTEEVLAYADGMAYTFITSKQSRSSISKATLINLYGQAVADIAYADTREKTDDRCRAEVKLEKETLRLIERDGYTTPAKIIKASITRTLKHYYLTQVWHSYFRTIIREHDLKYSQPTREERRRFDLISRKWIIRANKKTSIREEESSPDQTRGETKANVNRYANRSGSDEQ